MAPAVYGPSTVKRVRRTKHIDVDRLRLTESVEPTERDILANMPAMLRGGLS